MLDTLPLGDAHVLKVPNRSYVYPQARINRVLSRAKTNGN